jgi:hypothetical protein
LQVPAANGTYLEGDYSVEMTNDVLGSGLAVLGSDCGTVQQGSTTLDKWCKNENKV